MVRNNNPSFYKNCHSVPHNNLIKQACRAGWLFPVVEALRDKLISVVPSIDFNTVSIDLNEITLQIIQVWVLEDRNHLGTFLEVICVKLLRFT